MMLKTYVACFEFSVEFIQFQLTCQEKCQIQISNKILDIVYNKIFQKKTHYIFRNILYVVNVKTFRLKFAIIFFKKSLQHFQKRL